MQAKKNDKNKNRMELIPPIFLEETAKALTFGAKKYGVNNYRNGLQVSRLIGACMRHLNAWHGGEDYDPESGLNHLSHLSSCVAMLMQMTIHGDGEDDRMWKKKPYKLSEEYRNDGLPLYVSCEGELFPTPTMEEIEEMIWRGEVSALDDSPVDPDGYTPDGYPSWLVALDLI